MPLSMHPVDVGVRSELAVLNELTQLGFQTWTPTNPNARADLLIDLGQRLLRVQVKTGRYARGAVIFSTRSVRVNTVGWHARDYFGEVDYFGVHCPALGESYLVPIEDCAVGAGCLRVEPTRNNQKAHVRMAVDYRLRDFSPE